MAENGRSRVYLGIHFDFDDLVGQEVGQAVADSVAEDFSELELGDAPDRRPSKTTRGQWRCCEPDFIGSSAKSAG